MPPQVIPGGVLVTVPLPFPLLLTVSVYVISANVAVTDLAALIVATQSPAAFVHTPLQPVNVEPVPAEAVSVTMVL